MHIATVTLGILIALTLEAIIEAERTHNLVEHARRDFRVEYSANRAVVVADLKRSLDVRTELEGLITYGHARLANQAAKFPELQSTRSFVQVPTTAWDAAVATQALVHLPFGEAELISRAQSEQVSVDALQDRAEAEWFELAAYGDPQHLPQAEVEPALEKVSIAYAYLISVGAAEHHLISSYDAALRSLDE